MLYINIHRCNCRLGSPRSFEPSCVWGLLDGKRLGDSRNPIPNSVAITCRYYMKRMGEEIEICCGHPGMDFFFLDRYHIYVYIYTHICYIHITFI